MPIFLLLAVLLTLTALAAEPRATHSHPICGDSGCREHEAVQWQPLSNVSTTGNSYLAGGYYYLTNDIVVSYPIVTADNSTVVICLNGYAIRGLAYSRDAFHDNELIHIQADNNSLTHENHSKVTICDCRPNAEEHWIKRIGETYVIAGSEAECTSIDEHYSLNKVEGWAPLQGWTKFKGGVLASCDGGTCISVPHNTDFTVYGGTFLGGISKDGVDVWNEGYDVAIQKEGPTTVNLYGGTITMNQNGIKIPNNYSITMEGSPKIFGNQNLDLVLENYDSPYYPPGYLPKYIAPVISITGPLSGDAQIGIYKRFLTTANSYRESYDQCEVVIARGTDTYQITESDRARFVPRNGYTIDLVGNELILRQGHKHDVSMDCKNSANSQTFEMKTSKTLTGGVLAAGNYFLAEDVALASTLRIDGEVNLCLCGRQLSLKDGASGSVVEVLDGGKLTLCDCRPVRGSYRHALQVDGEEEIITGGLLTGGHAENGGAICVQQGGEAVVYGISMTGNTATGKGGALYVAEGGKLTLTGSRNSSTQDFEKGILRHNHAAEGGAVWNDGAVTLTTAEISYNQADAAGGGIGNNGELTLNSVTVSYNTAGARGGGICNAENGTLTLPYAPRSTEITNNKATAANGGEGGGIYNAGDWQASTHLVINANQAKNGGGVYNVSGFIMDTSANLSGNRATGGSGGGIYNAGTFSVSSGGTIEKNTAQYGGGIYNTEGAEASLRGSRMQLMKNTAVQQGGGVYNAGRFSFTAPNLTYYEAGRISGNKAAKGTGIYQLSDAVCELSGYFQFPTDMDESNGTDIPINKIYLENGAKITLTGALAQQTTVYPETQSLPAAGERILLAEADASYQDGVLAEEDRARFAPANPMRYEVVLEEGKVWLTTRPPHIHEGMTFENVLSGTIGNLSAGNYYLTEDITTSSGFSVSGAVHLCLNGHTIQYSGYGGSAVSVSRSSTLHLYDCGEGGICCSNGRGYNGISVEGGNLYLHGGTISGFQGNGVQITNYSSSIRGRGYLYEGVEIFGCGTGIYNNAGILEMYGGSIHDNTATASNSAGGVRNIGTFTMYDGSIQDNAATAADSVGGVRNSSVFTMYGGSIVRNSGTQGGGVVNYTNCPFTLAGEVAIANNTLQDGSPCNLYLEGRVYSTFSALSKFTIGEKFSVADGKRIGVTSQLEPTEEAPIPVNTANSEDYSAFFTSDDPQYLLVNSGEGEEQVLQLIVNPAGPHVHKFGGWQSDATNHWKVCECGKRDENALHAWNDGEITTPPTEEAEGEKVYTCAVCGRTKTEPVPKPEKPTYAITGIVTDNEDKPLAGILVELKQGSKTFDRTTTQNGGQYHFQEVYPGLYNVVATQKLTETQDQKIMTIRVRITNADAVAPKLTMPQDGTNSILEVPADDLTPDVVVDGLSDEAATLRKKTQDATKLTVQMTVKGKPEKMAENAQEIRTVAGEACKLTFLDIGVTMTVVKADAAAEESRLDETGRMMGIVVPFDFANKENVAVYRWHDGQAEALTPVSAEIDKTEAAQEGTYYLDRESGLIHIYAKKFSTYAIGYEEPAPPAVSGGPGAEAITYMVRLRKTDHGAADIRCAGMSSVCTENGVSFRRVRVGVEVTLVLTPEAGYRVANVRVLDDAGKAVPLTLENGVYRYVQPEQNVMVWALFSPQSGGTACPRGETCPIWPYTDADTRAWYHDGVHYCIEETLMVGVEPRTFAPDGTLSRGMMAQILYNRAGRPAVRGQSPFPDVTPEAWYYDAVVWGAENGILLGYQDGSFGPEDAVTREQMAAILWRSAGSLTVSHELAFSDTADISAYAVPALRWAAELGVLNGYSDGALRPRGETSRAEAAQMLQNYFGKLGAVLFLPET